MKLNVEQKKSIRYTVLKSNTDKVYSIITDDPRKNYKKAFTRNLYGKKVHIFVASFENVKT